MALLAVVLAVAGAYVALGASHPWDFETYYDAARCWRAGLNPYDLRALSALAGRAVELAYLYPPVSLALFLPLSYLDPGAAALAWLALQCLLAALLLLLWRRDFLPSVAPDVLVSVTVLGFNLALLWDLRTGNVALVECVLLWLAFSVLLRGRYRAAALLIALASIFKIYPILFLGLLATPGRPARTRWQALATGLAAFAVLLALPLGPVGAWVRATRTALAGPAPGIEVNGGVIGILDWLSRASGGSSPPPWTGPAVHAGFVLAVVAASAVPLRRSLLSHDVRDRIVSAVLLWLLVSPRPMVYAYVAAVAPALYIVYRAIASAAGRSAWVLGLVAPGIVRLLPGQPPRWLGAISFLTSLLLWFLWMRWWRGRAVPRTLSPASSTLPPHAR